MKVHYSLGKNRHDKFKKMPSKAGILLINKLPPHLKIIQYYKAFKRSCGLSYYSYFMENFNSSKNLNYVRAISPINTSQY